MVGFYLYFLLTDKQKSYVDKRLLKFLSVMYILTVLNGLGTCKYGWFSCDNSLILKQISIILKVYTLIVTWKIQLVCISGKAGRHDNKLQ